MRVIELTRADYDLFDDVDSVESETMGSYVYARTAWNYFMNTPGRFLCAYDEDKMVGIAHLYKQPDGAGWFEVLRVLPEYQNQGVGKALYESALDICERERYVSLSMYTGRRNVRSFTLAGRYGLTNTYDHHEYNLKVDGPRDNHGYKYLDWQKARELALPLAEQYGDFVSVNRTWYRINDENITMMADKGYFYGDEEGNFVCVGTRFQHGAKLFVLMLGGDYEKGIDFAVNLAAARNIETVTCTFTAGNEKLEQALKEQEFSFAGEMVTRERIF